MSAIDPLDLQLVLQLDPQAVLVDELASLPVKLLFFTTPPPPKLMSLTPSQPRTVTTTNTHHRGPLSSDLVVSRPDATRSGSPMFCHTLAPPYHRPTRTHL
ncbi:Os09g0377532 [Oryza sativa Japonica Group]|uniref:Os09g0377532 protein n=1 Tax=Oryza sativa subsp. japonica TaxID=39947 RepID=A0A0P0XM47_ORYSJ|nr:Os09g0377532 [Oryza sativa Japonica Group]